MSTALYRRYRPDTFADVIGQEHVTGPLVTALGKDAVSHAYLFSGPRGCGKTTSARILARCLNCAQGPTGSPCGQCESCRELATGGPGSLDVIEIDAASHGGVDDARDLRERATFAPVRDRYKIFIIDEAHMVTAAGFNALLKIVEEPPEHIKFIFATTEPDKVIGTIRSRTHHYPFRLVPPEPLLDYLERLCAAENVPVAPGVLQLVLRAGGGSVRDTLSVLDQLIAGSDTGGIDYDRAVALLGFTHSALLDDVVEAVAALDGAQAFSVVDRVVQSGQDPRRFVEDLLERLRDLIIVSSVPENPAAILRGVPEDQIRTMQAQAQTLSPAELSRAADITATALTEMVGATSPRLHLELLMARLLLPHAEQGHSSLAARLERLERRMDFTSGAGVTPASEAPSELAQAPEPTQTTTPAQTPRPAQPPKPAQAPKPVQEPKPTQRPAPSPADTPTAGASAETPAETTPPRSDDGWATPGVSWGDPVPVDSAPSQRIAETTSDSYAEPTAHAPARPERDSAPAGHAAPPQAPGAPSSGTQAPAAQRSPSQHALRQGSPAQSAQTQNAPSQNSPAQDAPAQAPAGHTRAPSSSSAPSGGSAEMMKRAWPDIVEAMKSRSRMLWMLVKGNVSVAGFDGKTLTLGFSNDGARATFSNRAGDQALNEAIQEILGMQVSFELVTGGAPPSGGGEPPKAEGRPEPITSAPATDTGQLGAPQAAAAEPESALPDSARPQPARPDTAQPDSAPVAHSPVVSPASPPAPALDHAPSATTPPTVDHRGPAVAAEQPHATSTATDRDAAQKPPKPPIPAFARRNGTTAAASAAPAVAPAQPRPSAPAGGAAGPGTAASSAGQPGSRAQEIRQRLASKRPAATEPPADPYGYEPPDPMYDNSPPPDWAEAAPPTAEEDIPSEDDIQLEHSGVFGRRAIERILGGVLLEERSLHEDGS
ncbi:DNA polymerase III subunit gamma and tau [Nesterenkonia rhizosphaerae]|uniref:DNA-directed DNA polymerase n=1 Tax=Nesterenkonia rhizosphaerae TaxID=1348272 RepID=A0ABP9FXN0_9MICC